MRKTSVVPEPDRPAALGTTAARRTAATLYAAAATSLVAAIVVSASTPGIALDRSTLITLAAYPTLLAIAIVLARPRDADRRAFDLATLHAGTLLVGSVPLAMGIGFERLGWLRAAGIALVFPMFAGIMAVFAGPATGFVVARQARRGIAYLAATLWLPAWIVRETLRLR